MLKNASCSKTTPANVTPEQNSADIDEDFVSESLHSDQPSSSNNKSQLFCIIIMVNDPRFFENS